MAGKEINEGQQFSTDVAHRGCQGRLMDNNTKSFTTLPLGRLAPAVLILLALLDGVLRLIPLSDFSHRAWEAMAYRHAPGAPFRANAYYHSDRCYGDLGYTANLPALRQFHSETFTTDAAGYRNPATLTGTNPPAAILTGSSFSVGCGVNDDETLSAQLGRLAGCTVYNFSNGVGPERRVDNLLACARRLHMTGGTVLYEYLNSHDLFENEGFLEFLEQMDPELRSDHAFSWLEQIQQWEKRTLLEPIEPWRTSRLQILAQRVRQRLENDRFFPNLGVETVGSRQWLKTGRAILFQGIPPPVARSERDAQWCGVYFSWLARQLHQHNFSLLVFLVPSRNTVYGPLLADQRPSVVGPDQSQYLANIEAQLVAARVPVVNLDPVLRTAAETELARGQMIYFPDDSHWNALGIAHAARAISQRFSCVTTP
jgi:hypothetical protein